MKRMLQEFRSVQQTYMPFMASLLATKAGEREGDIEMERLYLPSSVLPAPRSRCLDDAPTVEERMRETQCFTALENIRASQRAVQYVRSFKKHNIRGSKRSGRSFDLIKRISLKAKAAAATYRAGRSALFNLRGGGEWEQVLRELKDEDIRGLSSEIFTNAVAVDADDQTSKAEKQRANHTGKKMKPADVLLGSGSFLMSWIWTIKGALATAGDDEMNGLIRVEWQKSRARLARASEEMMLLRDERERTLVSLEYDAKRWEERASGWKGMTPEVADGVSAYAAKQASGRRRLADHFKGKWMHTAPVKKARFLDRIEVEEPEDSDSETEDSVSPANELRGPLPGLRERIDSHCISSTFFAIHLVFYATSRSGSVPQYVE